MVVGTRLRVSSLWAKWGSGVCRVICAQWFSDEDALDGREGVGFGSRIRDVDSGCGYGMWVWRGLCEGDEGEGRLNMVGTDRSGQRARRRSVSSLNSHGHICEIKESPGRSSILDI